MVPPRNQPEHNEQSMLLQWAGFARQLHPELDLLYAIPNGGKRSIAVARKLKAEGVRPGVPDLCLPVARAPYHSLYIEMKAGARPKIQPSQIEWHAKLRAAGHAVRVCYGWEAARDALVHYLTRDPSFAEAG